jgi:acetoin utilization deacetylase AcuC-like enzyme
VNPAQRTNKRAPRFVYSPGYYCDVGPHVFRTDKYRRLRDKMVKAGLVAPEDFLMPEPAMRQDLQLVHTPRYLEDLLSCRYTPRTASSEMPISREIVDAFVLGTGGTMLACRLAVTEHTFAMNMAGGFHHAFPDWGEGFCYVNDVAIGVRRLRRDGLVRRAMVVDCDLHQGNGTAYIFQNEPEVFTFSIHEEDIYPVKRKSSLDIGLAGFCSGDLYLSELGRVLPDILERHGPEFVLYVAGADPYEKDQLGSLNLSIEDLKRRDEMVLGACAERGIPVAVTLAGGYAPNVEDTVRIHYGTAVTMVELVDKLGPPSNE